MEMKPPISRAKMILITKAAIKAIKVKYNKKRQICNSSKVLLFHL